MSLTVKFQCKGNDKKECAMHDEVETWENNVELGILRMMIK